MQKCVILTKDEYDSILAQLNNAIVQLKKCANPDFYSYEAEWRIEEVIDELEGR